MDKKKEPPVPFYFAYNRFKFLRYINYHFNQDLLLNLIKHSLNLIFLFEI